MSPGREGEPEEANNMSYPSPGAEALDAGPFYHTSTRDETHEHHGHEEHQQPHDQHDSSQVHAQEQDHGQMPSHEAPSPQHHIARPPNLEELQLAAQLGQGLAGTPLIPATDPSMNVEDPSMRSIMSHPESDQHQTPSYVHETPAPDHMVPHTMPVAVGPPLPPQYSMGDGIPPRKRSKVSRACDECRRKKIKCDAQSDTGESPCSSCARSSMRCLFSRVPQKRGPSKGYIKELADRIHSIENKLESEGSLTQDEIDRLLTPGSHRAYNGLVPSDEAGRKRPFSGMSAGDFSTPAPPRQAPWGPEPRPILPAPASSDGFAGPGYVNTSLAPQPSAIKADSMPSKPPVASMDSQMVEAEEALEVDEDSQHDYLAHVQAIYPILPSSKARIQTLLSQCPSAVKTAFVTALQAIGQSSGDTQTASSLLHEWESSEAPHSRATDIVHAQTLLLLIIDADWRASSQLPFLLARAVALANTMKLWKFTPIESASEPDSDDQLCVRIWWSLVLMDRWHAAGTGKPSQIPDSSVVAPAGLENSVGEVCYYLIRLSKLLNRTAFVISTMQPGTSTAEPAMAAILADYIENYREDLPGHIEAASYPLVHLAYWHCKLLVTLLTPGATPTETLWPTSELATLLLANAHLRSPFTNHFVSLVTMSLAKLSKMDSSREGAARLMKEILEKPGGGHWDSVREKLTEQLRPTSSVEATASQGLQHLADLATAHEGIAPGSDDISFGPTLASGYLDVA
ncbi:n-terminal binuclear zn cluster-containing dna binding domain-containing [Trichoderma cornu-damae]|uniref:N-terminal binuclear zn cluster-containing dna binding domain-containing n=1 Tax=Trichoderma cornu-damae TaxID=654480 RepID=A0A9P8QNH0_9HYPO|nr:n-terminal binuclear zn cluster-containing dna binding domain-containing [Trichoderma cornu-damae]